MGVNLYVVDEYSNEYDGWDHAKQVGDREIAELELPKTYRYDELYEEHVWRPADFQAWRAAVDSSSNPDRFRGLLDLLEARPYLWVFTSW